MPLAKVVPLVMPMLRVIPPPLTFISAVFWRIKMLYNQKWEVQPLKAGGWEARLFAADRRLSGRGESEARAASLRVARTRAKIALRQQGDWIASTLN